MFNDLWVEKYRPQTLDTIVLTEQNKNKFKEFRETKTIPNLLFVGHAGIGKTSLARIVCKDILKCQYLYINASDENGIDTIRSKVTNFSRTQSFDGGIKCIILDETDGLSLDAQRALRNTMEEHANITRFILTANYMHRIIPPLQSRCQSFDLTPTIEGCVEYIEHVIESEKVQVSNKDDVDTFIRKNYPDLRKCINEIQKNIINNKLNTENLIKVKDIFIDSVYKIVKEGLALKARKKIIENEHVFGGDYTELLRSLFNHIDEQKLDQETKARQLMIVSEHIYRACFVADPEINFYSCLIQLSSER